MNDTPHETKKYTTFTPEEIIGYLKSIRKAILEGKYTISINENRQDNNDFIDMYKVDTKKEKEILLSIQHDDFCYAVDNEKPGYTHEKLYIFCKEYELDNWGTLETLEIYLKFNLMQLRRGDDYVYVVSFHKRKMPLKYLFK